MPGIACQQAGQERRLKPGDSARMGEYEVRFLEGDPPADESLLAPSGATLPDPTPREEVDAKTPDDLLPTIDESAQVQDRSNEARHDQELGPAEDSPLPPPSAHEAVGAAQPEELPQVAGYRVVRRMAGGGQGVILEAYELAPTGRHVVLKFPRRDRRLLVKVSMKGHGPNQANGNGLPEMLEEGFVGGHHFPGGAR